MSGCRAHKHLISGDCLRQATSKSMTAVEASSFPSVFKEGWLRLNKKVPFLSGADGVVRKFQQKIRCATRIFIRRLRDLLLTTPSAPLRNGILLLMAQPPQIENGWNGPVSLQTHSPPPRVATCGTVLRRITRGPSRKCFGGKLLSQRVRFIRSSFDWAVCSEPLARRTRAYGYSIAEGVVVGSKHV